MATKKLLTAEEGSRQVDAYMRTLKHPLKKEIGYLRDVILGVHKGITEQVKWAAPSFSYKGYLVTFNPRPLDHVHLVFHDAAALKNEGGILEGDYPDRRMAYFKDLKEIKAKEGALKKVIKEWIRRQDGAL